MEILVGDVRDKVAILIDDMCDTGETIKLATLALKEGGARSVYAVVSHGASPVTGHEEARDLTSICRTAFG